LWRNMTKTQTIKAFNVIVTRSMSNIVTFNNDRGVFIICRVFNLALLCCDGSPLVLAYQLGIQGFKGLNG
jgi:hypothetical protein